MLEKSYTLRKWISRAEVECHTVWDDSWSGTDLRGWNRHLMLYTWPDVDEFGELNIHKLKGSFWTVVLYRSWMARKTILSGICRVGAIGYIYHSGILTTARPLISPRPSRCSTLLIWPNSKHSICACTPPATAISINSSISPGVPAELPTIVNPTQSSISRFIHAWSLLTFDYHVERSNR